ncbi:MAG: DUF6286 domain-containing protein, partial [Haloechinothrix sp.]
RFSTAAETAHGLSWNEIPVAVVGGAAGALGLLLLLAAVLPGRPTVLPLTETPSESPLDVGAHRSGLHATLRAAVRSVDGVAGTKLKLSRRKISAKVKTDRTNTDGLADAVRAALEQRLDQIALAQNPQIRVRVASSRSSR